MLELFDSMTVETGPAAYAEAFDSNTFLKMPANALVNLGYLVMGGSWWVSP